MEVSSAKKKSQSTSSQDSQCQRGQNIQVFVRVRPLNASEKAQRSCSIVDTQGTKEVVIKDKQATLSATTKTFGFDRVFGPTSKQVDVHKAVVGPLIKQVLQGYNCTVFAYGQTGTGKTYTMEGLGEIRGAWENDPNAGIIPRALSDLFDGLRVADAVEYSVRVSFLELYNEEIFDLLSGADDQSKLRLYEDGQKKGSVIIQGLEEVQVNDKQEVFRILERGSIKRQTAETKMNATSSRSHTIFAVTVFINQQSLEGEDMLKIGKLNLVDLAGSENIGRSGAVNQRAREAGNINQSLLTLGRVITSLVDRTPHIPYRESKLTRLLQDSLGGRTKTSIIATISPASINHEETLSTLDYAHRAKNITNKPEVNQKISKKEKLLEYHHEIDKLKMELLAAREKDGVFLPKDAYEEQIKTKLRQEEEIVYLTKGLKAKEDEMENFLEMFNDTKARLEQTTEERDKTIRALDCTRSVLSKTENDKRQQEYLKQKHKETEKKISLQAKTLLSVSDNSTKDLLRVHDKLDRQKVIDVSNENLKCQFSNDFEEHQSSLTNTLRKSVDEQVMKSRKIEAMAVENGEKNNKMMSQLSSHYGQKLSKLIETLGNIRELTSNNEYAEQQWIAELIEKTNSEADLRSKQFQDYLIEKLLNAVNEILVTVVRQNDKITQLSSRISDNVTELDENLELFQEKQHNQIVSQHEGDNKILDELISLNETEKQNIALEIKEVDDHKRKQDDMYQKIMDLLEQTREEEKQYEEKRKRLLQSSMQDLERRDILSKKAQTLQIENANNVNILNDNYKKQQSQLINRMNGERKDTMNEINNLADTITCSAEELKSDSERFISDGKNAWKKHAKTLEILGTTRVEASKQSCYQIKSNEEGAKHLAATFELQLNSVLLEQKEDEKKMIIVQQEESSKLRENYQNFEKGITKEMKGFQSIVKNFIGNDLKKDVSTGLTPARVDRKFPRKIIEGTPDEIRIKDFRSSIDISGAHVTKILDMESCDGEDSVFSTSANISEPDATCSVDTRETGYGTEDDVMSIKSDKENCNPNLNGGDKYNKRGREFVKPRATKLKQPDVYDSQPNSRNGSRSGSRTRREIRS